MLVFISAPLAGSVEKNKVTLWLRARSSHLLGTAATAIPAEHIFLNRAAPSYQAKTGLTV
jgi:hypothetical protein